MAEPGTAAHPDEQLAYAGFWVRVGASVIDALLLLLIVGPIVYAIYGPEYLESDVLIQGPLDFLLTWVVPAIAVILFWIYKGGTPGKMAVRARIVDARTGGHPSNGQLIGRCFAYYVSLLGLGLGYLWVAWDRRKQGWHGKLAGTVVVRPTPSAPKTARFDPAA